MTGRNRVHAIRRSVSSLRTAWWYTAPAMCAKLLRTGEVEPSGLLARFDAGFLQLTRAYTAGVRWTLVR